MAASASDRSIAGDNVAAGQVLVAIDNPRAADQAARRREAAQAVALADLTRIEVGTRAEVIAERKAAVAVDRGQRASSRSRPTTGPSS